MSGEQRSTGEIGLSRIGAMGQGLPEQLADFLKQLELAKVMAAVVADQRYDPSPRSQAETPTPRQASKGVNGWRESEPLGPLPGDKILDRLCGIEATKGK